MKYLIYKTTNNINGKIYIGAHKTNDVNDGYLGSGRILKRAIKKYGVENFSKEILFDFDTPEEMFEMEVNLVDNDFVLRDDTYNLTVGGYGGFAFINSVPGLNHKNKDMKKCAMKGAKALREKLGDSFDEHLKKWQRKGRKRTIKMYGRFGGGPTFTGKKHTDEAKRKIGTANSKHQSGKNNSNYGKCWIYNLDLKKSMTIPKNDLEKWLLEG